MSGRRRAALIAVSVAVGALAISGWYAWNRPECRLRRQLERHPIVTPLDPESFCLLPKHAVREYVEENWYDIRGVDLTRIYEQAAPDGMLRLNLCYLMLCLNDVDVIVLVSGAESTSHDEALLAATVLPKGREPLAFDRRLASSLQQRQERDVLVRVARAIEDWPDSRDDALQIHSALAGIEDVSGVTAAVRLYVLSEEEQYRSLILAALQSDDTPIAIRTAVQLLDADIGSDRAVESYTQYMEHRDETSLRALTEELARVLREQEAKP